MRAEGKFPASFKVMMPFTIVLKWRIHEKQ
jgi:hypothetical protein